jgi:hypothetical protein
MARSSFPGAAGAFARGVASGGIRPTRHHAIGIAKDVALG